MAEGGMEDFYFVKSQRGKDKLSHNGFLYCSNKQRDEKTYWLWHDEQCKGKVVKNGNEITATTEHSHAPNPVELEVQKATSRLKDASKGHSKTSAIINTEVAQKVPAAAQGELIKEASMRRAIQRERRKYLPKLPKTAGEIELTGEWRQVAGEEWIMFEELDENNNKYLIFATVQNLTNLSDSTIWYGDGTFDVTPPLFAQLYSIHGIYLGRVIPLVFCLLPDKSTATYQKMLNAIIDKCNELGLQIKAHIFRFDFEMAIHKAISNTFSECSVECCFFHFSQANWRKVAELGLRQRYVSDLDFALNIRKVSALAFLPVSCICNAFQQLADYLADGNDYAEFLNYFAGTYVGRYKSKFKDNRVVLKWKKPIFGPETWSVYQRTVEGDPRTTNFLEGWHRRFSSVVGVSHPDIFKFLQSLQSEQCRSDMLRRALLRGESIFPPRRKDQIKINV